jgi:maltooligosyltrehalose trehalohydrolase
MISQFGPRLEPRGGVTFRLWAPSAERVDLVINGPRPVEPQPMERREEGWFVLSVPSAGPGTRYSFRIDGDLDVPDPASAFQPSDVDGPSEVIDHDYHWRHADWRGRPWAEAVILELHVGTFTAGGRLRDVIDRLDDIAAAGITAIELMPLADFPGRWNWGYDGVLWYAPDGCYGRPDDLRALVDAAHARGLMVFLDVVYNHFGPEGNYLGRYARPFFTPDHRTPWGDAIDYAVPQVRAFAIENALHWLMRYRFDGLRLDAVHALVEPGGLEMLRELSEATGELAAASGRAIHLMLENDHNDTALLDPLQNPPQGKYRAQWNDDYHHAWHVLLTGEEIGYYRDYTADLRDLLARVMRSGFAYQGQSSAHRGGEPRGGSTDHLAPTAFINFLQNHDQIGNRPFGDRLVTLAPDDAVAAALAVLLPAPMPPLLFMGEEWGAREPFPFFCDFKGDLGEAVRRGRRSEFDAHHLAVASTPGVDGLPDPLAEATFRSAALDWTARAAPAHRERLALVRDLLAARRAHIVPRLGGLARMQASASWTGPVLQVRWRLGDRTLGLLANLGTDPAARPRDWMQGVPIWGGAPAEQLMSWQVHWTLGDA